MESPAEQLTQLLKAWSEGHEDALEKLMPVVYEDLHRLARRYMSDERPGHTLQATALVNEAYMRLLDSSRPTWESRAHFFAVSGRIMRRILVDWARSRTALKRGSNVPPLELDEAIAALGRPGADLVAIDDALQALATLDLRKSQVVELRFFGGLSAKETAEVLHVSEETVLRDWKLSKSWLRREMRKEPPGAR
jgi:RNA polymerase sigma factor (TIGR02999 family)